MAKRVDNYDPMPSAYWPSLSHISTALVSSRPGHPGTRGVPNAFVAARRLATVGFSISPTFSREARVPTFEAEKAASNTWFTSTAVDWRPLLLTHDRSMCAAERDYQRLQGLLA